MNGMVRQELVAAALLLATIFAAAAIIKHAYGQTSGCINCRYRPLDQNVSWEAKQIEENKEVYARRKRFEEKWGPDGVPFSDQALKRIEENPNDSDCWQYTPRHC